MSPHPRYEAQAGAHTCALVARVVEKEAHALLVKAHQDSHCGVTQKGLKLGRPFVPAVSFLGSASKGNETIIQQEHLWAGVYAALLTRNQHRKEWP